MKGDEDCWIEENEMDSEILAKVAGLRFLTKRLKSMIAGDNPKRALQEAAPVLRLLLSIITQEGEITKDQSTWYIALARAFNP